jgi:hypothetical protein
MELKERVLGYGLLEPSQGNPLHGVESSFSMFEHPSISNLNPLHGVER